jgi:hypothetical protein
MQTTGESTTLLSGYEELRSQALRHRGCVGRGNGLALVVRRGLAAWLTACAPVTRTLEVPQPKTAVEDRLPVDLRTEVAMVLAEMALTAAHIEGAPPC